MIHTYTKQYTIVSNTIITNIIIARLNIIMAKTCTFLGRYGYMCILTCILTYNT